MTVQVLRRATILRKRDGKLGLFVGTEEIHGIGAISSSSDERGSYTNVVFDNVNLHFDTEESAEKEKAN